jgi:hypothetical protein
LGFIVKRRWRFDASHQTRMPQQAAFGFGLAGSSEKNFTPALDIFSKIETVRGVLTFLIPSTPKSHAQNF